MTKAYEIKTTKYDSSRPYVVFATFRSFNKVVGYYATEADAKRRQHDMNALHEREGM